MAPHRNDEEGQVALALLVVVLVLLFLGYALAQIGSAGDQATQTQTLADSGAVADAHILGNAGVSAVVHQQLPTAFEFGAPLSAGLATAEASGLLDAACSAAQSNWASNPHKSGLDCGQVDVSAGTGSATVSLTAPAGEVSGGPLDASSARGRATATARVVVAECPAPTGASAAGQAVADWVAQSTSAYLGTPGPLCYTPADAVVLADLQLLDLSDQLAAIGPPGPLVDAVAKGLRAEIIR